MASVTMVLPPLVRDGAADGLRFPALEMLLARGDRAVLAGDSFQQLWQLFGHGVPDGDLPAGAVCRAGHADAAEGCWLRADPVHLVAQRDRILIAGTVELSAEEKYRIAESFNGLFGADGWSLQPGGNGWLLRAALPCAIRTVPTREAVGRSMEGRLPAGEDALQWHRFLNEVQMFLHGSPVNSAREARQEVTANGLWLWGAGALPRPAGVPWDAVYGGECFTRGLSRLAGLEMRPLPQEFPVPDGTNALVSLYDERAVPALQDLESRWFAPLVAHLRSGAVESAQLRFSGGLRVSVTRGNLRRWWRRRRPLSHWLRY